MSPTYPGADAEARRRRSLRVLLAQDTFFPVIGGAEIHVANLAKALRERDHDVTIATATPGPASWESFTVDRFPSLTRGGRRALARLAPQLPRLRRLASDHDLVHCHYSFFLAGALAVVLGQRTPMVVTLHGLGTLDSSVEDSQIRKIYRRLSLARADRIIATSEELAAVACRFAPSDRIVVIPNAVSLNLDQPRPTPQQEDGVLRVAAVRRLNAKNGVQYLVEAAPEIVKELEGRVTIRIVGDGPLAPYLRNRVHELGVQKFVEFLGTLPNDEATAVVADADVVIFPSSAESTSIAALEAMACGKAVVASAVGAFPEMIGNDERGLLVPLFSRRHSDYNPPLTLPPDRISALAQSVLRLASDPLLRHELGEKGREYVRRHHDWNVIVLDTERCYWEAIEQRRPHATL